MAIRRELAKYTERQIAKQLFLCQQHGPEPTAALLLALKALLNDFRQDPSSGTGGGGGGGGGGGKEAQAAQMPEGVPDDEADVHEVEAAVARIYASQRKLLCRLHADLTEAVSSVRAH